MITNSFIVIRDFIRDQLDQDPLTLLGSSTWEVLTNIAEVYEKEKEECTEHFYEINWEYACLESALSECQCPKCGSGLIDVTANNANQKTAVFTCRSCGQQWPFEELAPLAMSDYFTRDNYRSVRNVEDPETITCPECGKDTYVLEENVCVLCEESVERQCRMCSTEIPYQELNLGGYCSWCAHMWSKDD